MILEFSYTGTAEQHVGCVRHHRFFTNIEMFLQPHISHLCKDMLQIAKLPTTNVAFQETPQLLIHTIVDIHVFWTRTVDLNILVNVLHIKTLFLIIFYTRS